MMTIETLEDLFFSDLEGDEYLAAEAAVLDEKAGKEWRAIADAKGYYTAPDAHTEEETERNVNQFTYFDE